MAYTVPPVPDGLHHPSCWRRQLTALNPRERGGFRTVGAHLHPGDTVELPEGALVLAVDCATRGWEDNYRTIGRHPVKDATVTVYLAAEGELVELWSRHYIQRKSAFGAFTMKKLTALLEKHPVPEGEPVVVHEVRRPNYKAGTCRWCRAPIGEKTGHLVGHGEDAEVEHYRECPPSLAQAGDVCELCGKTVFSIEARRVLVRDGSGRHEVHHRIPGVDCRKTPVPSVEEHEAERAEAERIQREQERKRQADRERRAEKKAAKEAAERAALEAEQARIAELEIVKRVSETRFDKGLGGGLRCCLQEHLDTLSDGSTTKRWSVETYFPGGGGGYSPLAPDDGGEDVVSESESFTHLKDARDFYRTFTFDPQRFRHERPADPADSSSWRMCAECGGGGAVVERRDSSGIEGWVCRRCDRENPDDVMLSFA